MAKKTITLTAGHGGSDTGANNKKTPVRYEKDETYKLVSAIRKYILDNYNAIENDVKIQCEKYGSPSQFYNNIPNAEVRLSFHFNATPNAKGTENLYKNKQWWAKEINKVMGKYFTNRGVKYYPELYVFNKWNMDTLTEVCFIDSKSDMAIYDKNFSKIVADLGNLIASKSGYTKLTKDKYPVGHTTATEITNLSNDFLKPTDGDCYEMVITDDKVPLYKDKEMTQFDRYMYKGEEQVSYPMNFTNTDQQGNVWQVHGAESPYGAQYNEKNDTITKNMYYYRYRVLSKK